MNLWISKDHNDDHSGDDDRKVEMMRTLFIIFGNYDGSHDNPNHRNINNIANNDTTITNNNNITSITTHDYQHCDDVNYWMDLINHSEDARTLFLQHLDEKRSGSMLLKERSYDVMCVAMKVCFSQSDDHHYFLFQHLRHHHHSRVIFIISL